MNSKNRINPDHYRIAGREIRPGEAKGPVAKSSGRVRSRQSKPSKAAAEERFRNAPVPAPQDAPAKRGQRSSAQKGASRHSESPQPAAQPVSGAFGKTGSLTEAEETIVGLEPDNEEDDFLAQRRRQNKHARK